MNSSPSTNRNLPGVPIMPGRNTPLIQTGSPKNVPVAPGLRPENSARSVDTTSAPKPTEKRDN
jgi:hypothetical protein